MAEDITIARPYAEALFSMARDSQTLDAWSASLSDAALLANDPQMRALFKDPNVSASQVAALFVSMTPFSAEATSLIRVLADNDRLALLPEIRMLYEQLKAEAQREADAEIVAAQPLTDPQISQLKDHLERHFNRRVNVSVSVDPALIGGARIVVGDVVIDGSVAGQLAAMQSALTH